MPTISAQRLRNLTTERLHTEMDHVYQDLEIITKQQGLLTHMLPRVNNAVLPWLREKVKDQRFWDGEFDPSHTGDVELPEATAEELEAMLQRYLAQPNPLAGKPVIAAVL